MSKPLRIGSLFSGIGGLDLAVECVTGGEVAWFCESDPYARRVLARQWPGVPIFEDVREVQNPPGVDVLCGGFPCQDISNAGKRAGITGEKSGLWSEFARLIRTIRPQFVFLENVAAITVRGIGRVLADLAGGGFNAEWGCIRAADVGALHLRNRWFCYGWLADANGEGFCMQRGKWWRAADGCGATRASCGFSDTHRGALWELRQWLWQQHRQQSETLAVDAGQTGSGAIDPFRRDSLPAPGVCRGADGSARVVDRLRCLGNSVVPHQAAWAFSQLMERAGDE